jgi:transcriptional regulator of acetoin/glycerol metabolism
MRRQESAPLEPPGCGVLTREVFAPQIRASHERSQRFGLSSRDKPDFSTSRSVLATALEQNRNLLSHALPVMETLYQQIVNTHNMVILTDAKGLILHVCGDDDFLQRADRVALKSGVEWSEESKGTNAIGTALVAGEPTVVHASEHFLSVNHFLTCSCAPVLDPFGATVGALDISGEHHSFHKHTLALVRMSAQMIENHFFADTFPQGVCIHFHSRPEFIGTLVEGIAVFTPAGKFLSANGSGQFQLGLSLRALQAHTFSSLFGLSISSLVDQHRRSSTGVLSCCMHNGVTVYLRVEYNAPPLFLPAQPNSSAPPPAAAAKPEAQSRLQPSSLHYLDTGDPQVARVIGQLNKVSGRDISVLILGETGTGKELLARAIHSDSSRRGGPFVAINCASIPEGLIESELFGYTEGAFTGGRKRGHPGKILGANGGTLFLDEIGDMPLPLQARLLRVIEERQVTPLGTDKSLCVDIALVCATHRDLRALIEAESFREDLYYRINGLVVRLPRLRERTDLDVVIRNILAAEHLRDLTLDPEVMDLFRRFPWPGNVRQLANLLRTAERMVDADRVIRREHLPDDFFDHLPDAGPALTAAGTATAGLAIPLAPAPAKAVPCAGTPPTRSEVAAPGALGAEPSGVPAATASLDDLEWQAIRETLARNEGNVSATARALGISRNTIYRRLMSQATRS